MRVMRGLVLLAVLASIADADTGPDLLLRPDPRDGRGDVALEVQAYLDGRIEGGGPLDLVFTRVRARSRLSSPESRRVVAGLSLDRIDLDGAGLPSDLTDLSFAVGAELGSLGEWDLAASAGAGFSGDEPFSDGSAWYGIGTVAATRKVDERSDLTLLVAYDGNRGFLPDWPLPGVAYSTFVGPHLRYTLGLPFNSVSWKPAPKWEVEARAILPVGGSVRVSYGEGSWRLFAGYRAQRAYFHLDGTPRRFRLRYEEHLVEGGVTWSPRPRADLTLAAGWGFAREFENRSDSGRDFGKVELSDEPFLALRVDVRF